MCATLGDQVDLPFAITPVLVREALTLPSPLPAPGPRPEAKPAAVVVPIRFAPEPAVIAVVRSEELRDHPGEVGFPGGKLEAHDRDLRAAAFREAEEEVALAPDDLDELGTLSPIPVVTGRFLIHPFVAAVLPGRIPRVASRELSRLVELPLAPFITGARRHGAVATEWRGRSWLLPHFDVSDRVLYGASAFIFYELLLKLASALGVEMPEPRVQLEYPWGSRYA